MHERTSLADELSAAMLDAPDLCAQCGAILSDTEPYLCDACTETAYCADSDICEPWSVRTNPYYAPADRYGISVLGVLLLACLVAAIVGTAGLERVKAQAPSDVIRAPHAINGRIYEWPYIGTPEYSASCSIVEFYEDGWARAFCTEDGAMYIFNEGGQPYPNTSGTPITPEGWYAVENTR